MTFEIGDFLYKGKDIWHKDSDKLFILVACGCSYRKDPELKKEISFPPQFIFESDYTNISLCNALMINYEIFNKDLFVKLLNRLIK